MDVGSSDITEEEYSNIQELDKSFAGAKNLLLAMLENFAATYVMTHAGVNPSLKLLIQQSSLYDCSRGDDVAIPEVVHALVINLVKKVNFHYEKKVVIVLK